MHVNMHMHIQYACQHAYAHTICMQHAYAPYNMHACQHACQHNIYTLQRAYIHVKQLSSQ